MYGNGTERFPTSSAEFRITTGNSKLDALLGELSDGEDEGSEESFRPVPSVSLLDPADPLKPWQDDFHAYLNSKDHLGGLTVTNGGVSMLHATQFGPRSRETSSRSWQHPYRVRGLSRQQVSQSVSGGTV